MLGVQEEMQLHWEIDESNGWVVATALRKGARAMPPC